MEIQKNWNVTIRQTEVLITDYTLQVEARTSEDALDIAEFDLSEGNINLEDLDSEITKNICEVEILDCTLID